jgi:hypothetical protein
MLIIDLILIVVETVIALANLTPNKAILTVHLQPLHSLYNRPDFALP